MNYSRILLASFSAILICYLIDRFFSIHIGGTSLSIVQALAYTIGIILNLSFLRKFPKDRGDIECQLLVLTGLFIGDIQWHLYNYFDIDPFLEFGSYSYEIIHTPFLLAQFILVNEMFSVLKKSFSLKVIYSLVFFISIISFTILYYVFLFNSGFFSNNLKTFIYLLQSWSGIVLVSLAFVAFLFTGNDSWTYYCGSIVIMWGIANQFSWGAFTGMDLGYSIPEFIWGFGLLLFVGSCSVAPLGNFNTQEVRSLSFQVRSLFVVGSTISCLFTSYLSSDFENKFFWYVFVWSSTAVLVSGYFSNYIRREMANFHNCLIDLVSDAAVSGSHINSPANRFSELNSTYSKVFETALAQSNELIRAKSIAQTTQMLAHDVRKPFTMLQGVLSMISRADSLREVKEINREYVPEIERGISSVNGMIQDVMEVGSKNAKLTLEEVNPESLIEITVIDGLRYFEQARIRLLYNFQHNHKLSIDVLKASRIFANIIGNGAQAMKYKGEMWFKTKTTRNGFIQFTIGNSNSYIPPEEIEKLFEAFFTSGKKGGTGLGLAIAKKVVVSHGGEIWCTSKQGVGTEFHFTLPTSESQSDYTGELPASSEEIREAFTVISSSTSKETEDVNEQVLEKGIIKELQGKKCNISILLVDDEKLYTTVLENQLTSNPELSQYLTIKEASSGEEAIQLVKDCEFDIIIQDVDMGCNHLNGFETVEALRKIGSKATICIHSNRGGPQYHKMAIDSGADMFIAKTMPREHFLRMIFATMGDPDELFKNNSRSIPLEEEESTVPSDSDSVGNKFAVIEDNKVFQAIWAEQGDQIAVFGSPTEFFASPNYQDYAAVITDYHFDNDSSTGKDVSDRLRKENFSPPICLCSNADTAISGFDAILPKHPRKALEKVLAMTTSSEENEAVAANSQNKAIKEVLVPKGTPLSETNYKEEEVVSRVIHDLRNTLGGLQFTIEDMGRYPLQHLIEATMRLGNSLTQSSEKLENVQLEEKPVLPQVQQPESTNTSKYISIENSLYIQLEDESEEELLKKSLPEWVVLLDNWEKAEIVYTADIDLMLEALAKKKSIFDRSKHSPEQIVEKLIVRFDYLKRTQGQAWRKL